ncbi:MAG: hypothetical protein PWQ16_463 [bacterium]|nr:hypothetical protein [bacterium]
MIFSIIALTWFLLEKGWNFFKSGEKNIRYIMLVLLTALILIYGGYKATFEGENIMGSLLALAGMGLGLWGRSAMKESFSVKTEKPEKLIKSGPYAIIRHPLYLGLILLCMGGVIASSSKLLIIPFLINLVVIIKKVKTEEELLESLPEFKEYKSRTWKLIPFLW